MKKLFSLFILMILGSCSMLQGPMEYNEKKGNFYLIHFDGNESNVVGNMSSQKVEEKKTVSLKKNQFIREGYNFDGWAKDENGDKVYDDQGMFTMGNSNTTLYAKWGKNPGVIDENFNVGNGINNNILNYINSIAVQSDGKILIGGGFTKYNEIGRNNIARLNSDGTLDNSFNIGSGFNDFVNIIQILSDGKILAGGFFSSYNGENRGGIARLNPNGTLDNSFNVGSGFSGGFINAIDIQSDGKILAGGFFSSYNGENRGGIARLNSDGTLDNSFNVGSGFSGGFINAITIQSDGKILIGGNFTNYNGENRGGIARLNSDGTLDNSFNIGSGFNDSVNTIQVLSDGKILIGGDFTKYNGINRGGIVRLNSDGSLDTTFNNSGNGVDISVYAIAVQSDSKVLMGGV